VNNRDSHQNKTIGVQRSVVVSHAENQTKKKRQTQASSIAALSFPLSGGYVWVGVKEGGREQDIAKEAAVVVG
jgi:threonine dehydrogenase-like Zn-dependent dehydrogenase